MQLKAVHTQQNKQTNVTIISYDGEYPHEHPDNMICFGFKIPRGYFRILNSLQRIYHTHPDWNEKGPTFAAPRTRSLYADFPSSTGGNSGLEQEPREPVLSTLSLSLLTLDDEIWERLLSDWFICFNVPIVEWAGPTKSEKYLLGINSYFHSAEALNITNLRTGLNLLLIKCSPSQQVSWGSFCQAWVSTLHCFVC